MRRTRAVLIAVLLLALFGAVFVTSAVVMKQQKMLPKASAIGGPFVLSSTDGAVVTERDLLGTWSLIYFGYTFCPDACPTALSDMTLALERLGPASAQITPFFITVDPKRDSPAALADYLKSFDPRIRGLSGSEAQTVAAAAAYRVYIKPQPTGGGDFLIDHSAYVYVMDPHGQFVDVIDGATSGDAMAAKVKEMMSAYL